MSSPAFGAGVVLRLLGLIISHCELQRWFLRLLGGPRLRQFLKEGGRLWLRAEVW